ncbi:restriction endonuclease subunit S [Micromonospora sp. WMMD882]|uniref:restriction endonuclease subunit S n=1 Tax=Micromonospora sp. WMMD882 TaxID=3015151 RepID=UPI00248D33D9|nr:restriction endonuclease subunit S [Micromonospora sp. WMMD882]WBB78650.1 restriction endonuclease subunit S [Micromonospora sp. WMMD882]
MTTLAVSKLADVASINPKLVERPEPEDVVSFVPMSAVDAETGATGSGEDRLFGEVSKGYTLFANQDILVAKITPCFENGKIAQACLSRPTGVGSTEFHVVRPKGSALDARYLLHFLRRPAIRASGERRMTGSAGQRRVPEAFLANLAIPTPSLSEQQRIAQALDRADELRTKRREALAHLNDLTQSIFLDTFGDPTHNPRAWPITRIGLVAEVQGGLQLSGSRSKHPVEVPYLRVANVHRSRLNLTEIKTLRASHSEISRTSLRDGDLLIVEGHGNPEEIGRAALWNNSISPCVHQNHLIRVRFDPEVILPSFASYFVNSIGGRQHLLRAGRTTSGLNTISVSDVRSTPIATPPLNLQNAFTDRIEEVDVLRTAHLASLAEMDALFASLQDRAFRGLL